MATFKLFKKKQDEAGANGGAKKHYLSGKEVRQIARANAVEMRRLEKFKNRRANPSEYTTELKDKNNILEVELLNGETIEFSN